MLRSGECELFLKPPLDLAKETVAVVGDGDTAVALATAWAGEELLLPPLATLLFIRFRSCVLITSSGIALSGGGRVLQSREIDTGVTSRSSMRYGWWCCICFDLVLWAGLLDVDASPTSVKGPSLDLCTAGISKAFERCSGGSLCRVTIIPEVSFSQKCWFGPRLSFTLPSEKKKNEIFLLPVFKNHGMTAARSFSSSFNKVSGYPLIESSSPLPISRQGENWREAGEQSSVGF